MEANVVQSVEEVIGFPGLLCAPVYGFADVYL